MTHFKHMGRVVPCPYCGTPNNAVVATEPGPEKPEPGSMMLCFNCGGLGMYLDDMTLRKATEEEEAQMADRPDVYIARRAIKYTANAALASSFMEIMTS